MNRALSARRTNPARWKCITMADSRPMYSTGSVSTRTGSAMRYRETIRTSSSGVTHDWKSPAPLCIAVTTMRGNQATSESATARRRSALLFARCHWCAFQSHVNGAASNGNPDVDDSTGATQHRVALVVIAQTHPPLDGHFQAAPFCR